MLTAFLHIRIQNEKLKRSGSTVSRKGPTSNADGRAFEYFALNGDGDVWVERRVKMKGKGRQFKPYFRSVRTDVCIWEFPPTGASFVVFHDELNLYPFLKDFALKPMGKPLWTIEPARKTTEGTQKKRLLA